MTSYNSYDRYFKNKKLKLDKKQKNLNFNFLFEICVIIVLGLTAFYFIVYPVTHNLTLARFIWIPGFLLSFVSCIICLTQQNEALEILEILGFLALTAITIGGYISAGFGFDLVFSVAAFLTLLMSMWLYSGVRISKRLFDIIYYTGVFLTFLFAIYSFTSIATTYHLNGEVIQSDYFVFNLDNSNAAGMFLYGIIGILVVNFPQRKYKTLNLIMILANLYFIYRTNSRSCIIAAVVVLLFAIFINGNKKISSLVIVLSWLFPIVFVFIYLYLYNSGFEDIEVLNKSFFSGREEVFIIYLEKIKAPIQYIFGNLAEARLQNGHNAPVAFYSSLGFVGAVITEALMLLSVFRINKPTKNANLSVLVISGIFIHSCAEASMLLGGFPGSVFVIIFYLLANYSEENSDKIMF